jgi:hypothetical protein
LPPPPSAPQRNSVRAIWQGRVAASNGYSRRSFISRIGRLGRVRPPGLKRIGFLTGNEPTLINAFNNSELRRPAYIEGKNIAVEIRTSRPNSSDNVKYAAELARMDLELVAVAGLPEHWKSGKRNPSI